MSVPDDYEDLKGFEALEEEFQVTVEVIAESMGWTNDTVMSNCRTLQTLWMFDCIEEAISFFFESLNSAEKIGVRPS